MCVLCSRYLVMLQRDQCAANLRHDVFFHPQMENRQLHVERSPYFPSLPPAALTQAESSETSSKSSHAGIEVCPPYAPLRILLWSDCLCHNNNYEPIRVPRCVRLSLPLQLHHLPMSNLPQCICWRCSHGANDWIVFVSYSQLLYWQLSTEYIIFTAMNWMSVLGCWMHTLIYIDKIACQLNLNSNNSSLSVPDFVLHHSTSRWNLHAAYLNGG
jgi:hypothetical protein